MENGKNLSAVVEMLNTYFKMFAGDEINAKAFYDTDNNPHPWTEKAFETVESRIRMAMYTRHHHQKEPE